MNNIKNLEGLIEMLYDDYKQLHKIVMRNMFLPNNHYDKKVAEEYQKPAAYAADTLLKMVTIYETLKREQNQLNLQKEIYERQQSAIKEQLKDQKK